MQFFPARGSRVSGVAGVSAVKRPGPFPYAGAGVPRLSLAPFSITDSSETAPKNDQTLQTGSKNVQTLQTGSTTSPNLNQILLVSVLFTKVVLDHSR